jgi:hypothetical protein
MFLFVLVEGGGEEAREERGDLFMRLKTSQSSTR